MRTRKPAEVTVEMDFPSLSCGRCHFTSSLDGQFAVEDGILVFRTHPDPQPGRGPDLTSCGECGAQFTSVTWEWGRKRLPLEGLAGVRETAAKAREKEWELLQGEPG